MLPLIPEDEEIAIATADGANDTRRHHTAIIARGADEVTPIRWNVRACKKDCPEAWARNEILRATAHLGRALWKR
ncbi:hypothetical protein GCM10011415_29610 [Salipiger pallidus]|uniref:Transposase DDE domain-containing protein n=1 Tax=Salipiger pallidus TaxID=1775170 RepID=A0A8J2ZLQ3_9RHOB|nr:hypothetical protein GCM10011415_29610 [Salipiger pallidus]